MSGFVLDASFALAYLLPDEEAGFAVRAAMVRQDADRVVPSLWWVEIGNAFVTRRRRQLLTDEELARLVGKLSEFPVRVEPGPAHEAWSNAVHLAGAHKLSMYDAIYLELALRLVLPLATLDSALRRAAQAQGVSVIPS